MHVFQLPLRALWGENGGGETVENHRANTSLALSVVQQTPDFLSLQGKCRLKISIFEEVQDKRIVGSADGRESNIQGVREIRIHL